MAHLKETSFITECFECRTPVKTQPYQKQHRKKLTCSRSCAAKVKRRAVEERRTGYTQHQLDRLARYSPEARKWREAVFNRDDFTCQCCMTRGGYLEADHIRPWAFFTVLRFELSNGRTLCRPCHDKTKVGAKKLREMYADQIV